MDFFSDFCVTIFLLPVNDERDYLSLLLLKPGGKRGCFMMEIIYTHTHTNTPSYKDTEYDGFQMSLVNTHQHELVQVCPAVCVCPPLLNEES